MTAPAAVPFFSLGFNIEGADPNLTELITQLSKVCEECSWQPHGLRVWIFAEEHIGTVHDAIAYLTNLGLSFTLIYERLVP